MTRFEHGDRFVELTPAGTTIHRRWGSVGHGTFERTDSYADEAVASQALLRQLRSLEHRGYRSGRSDARLEALIRANPDDERTYLVYADWLQEQNDPRGLLIATMAAGEPYQPLLDAHRAQFVPSIKQQLFYVWTLGFMTEAHLETPHWAVVRRVLRHPSAIVLRTLKIEAPSVGYGERLSDWNRLTPFLPATLTRIEVGERSALWTQRQSLAPELANRFECIAG